jgi:hypothetical protein
MFYFASDDIKISLSIKKKFLYFCNSVHVMYSITKIPDYFVVKKGTKEILS